MDRKLLLAFALILIALSVVYFPIAQASTTEPPSYDPEAGMTIFNTFLVDVQLGSETTETIYVDNTLSDDSQLLSLQTDGRVAPEEPVEPVEPVGPSIPGYDTVTMSTPASTTASEFTVTLVNIDYSAEGSSGRVTALKFEVNATDHRMFAVSAVGDQGEPAFSLLYYESYDGNMIEGFGDWVHMSGRHTLAEHYIHLSHVMTNAIQNIYTNPQNAYHTALKAAYKNMADYSKQIARELKQNPELSPYNKESEGSSALLTDPTFSGSGYWWTRFLIKLALYSALVYAIYWIWTLIWNPGAGALMLAVLVPALWAFGQLVVPVVVDMFTMALRIWAPAWGWFSWVPEGVAWMVENAASLVGFAVFAYKAIVYSFWPYVAGLFWTCLWWFVDYTIEYVFDYLWWFRDY